MNLRQGSNQHTLLAAFPQDGEWATIIELMTARKVPADRSYAGLLRTAQALVDRGYLAEAGGCYQVTTAGMAEVKQLE